MKVSHVESVASYNGLESCGAARKDGVEALTEERAGWVLSREMNLVWDADPVRRRGRPQPRFRIGEEHWNPARSETPGMHGNNLRENREILRSPRQGNLGRIVKSKDARR